ncbi:MAG: hypothetical protein ACTHME_06230 [Candidatus Nitrosocosmicus sp.]
MNNREREKKLRKINERKKRSRNDYQLLTMDQITDKVLRNVEGISSIERQNDTNIWIIKTTGNIELRITTIGLNFTGFKILNSNEKTNTIVATYKEVNKTTFKDNIKQFF